MTVLNGDKLRAHDQAYLADQRNTMFGLNSIEQQYYLIKGYELCDSVPEKIVIQYEVARNVYLYAFNVYRFYMIAQHQALITLEFAIKERFGIDEIKQHRKEVQKEQGINIGQGLKACLYYIFDKGFVENKDFPVWQKQRQMQARYDYGISKIQEMEKKKLKEIELDYNEINYEESTIEYDYLSVLKKVMPNFRNEHAHGSDMLHNHVLITFENVSIIINKIFDK